MTNDLSGSVAVITGAASGIGRALAHRCAQESMAIVISDVESVPLVKVESELVRAGAQVLAVQTDVSNDEAVDALAARTFDRFGAVHRLFINAGVFQAGVAWQRSKADWEWVLGVNLWGPINAVRAFIPRMLKQGDAGHVVITSSLAGLITVPYSSPYVVSKFGAAALAECLAHDLAAQAAPIQVSCLVPGSVDTQIADSDRNRPTDLGDAEAEDHRLVAAALQEMVSRGANSPDSVVDTVFAAMAAGDFWITTSDSYPDFIDQRYQSLKSRRLPSSVNFD